MGWPPQGHTHTRCPFPCWHRRAAPLPLCPSSAQQKHLHTAGGDNRAARALLWYLHFYFHQWKHCLWFFLYLPDILLLLLAWVKALQYQQYGSIAVNRGIFNSSLFSVSNRTVYVLFKTRKAKTQQEDYFSVAPVMSETNVHVKGKIPSHLPCKRN